MQSPSFLSLGGRGEASKVKLLFPKMLRAKLRAARGVGEVCQG